MSSLLERGIDVAALKEAKKESEWHALRKTCITGSQAASLLGFGFNTPFEAYQAYKTEDRPWDVTPEMDRGHLMEVGILQRYAKRSGLELTGELFFRHPDFNWLGVTVDAIACEVGDDFANHPKRVIEAKTAGQFVAAKWFPDDAREPIVPLNYEIQAMLEMACTGLPQCDIAVFIEGEGFFVIPIYRDQKREEELIDKLRIIWFDHIVPGVPPPMTDDEKLGERAKAESDENLFLEAPAEILKAIDDYRIFGKAASDNEKYQKVKRDIICAAVGNAAGFMMPDGRRVKVARETRSSFDMKAAQAAVDERLAGLGGERIVLDNFRTTSNPFFKIYMPRTGGK